MKTTTVLSPLGVPPRAATPVALSARWQLAAHRGRPAVLVATWRVVREPANGAALLPLVPSEEVAA